MHRACKVGCVARRVNLVEVSSASGRGTSGRKIRWATAHAQQKESWAQLGPGPTLEVMRDANRDPAPIPLNENAGREATDGNDTADQSEHVLRLRGREGPNAIWSM